MRITNGEPSSNIGPHLKREAARYLELVDENDQEALSAILRVVMVLALRAAGARRPTPRHCSACGETGHDRRVCDRRRARERHEAPGGKVIDLMEALMASRGQVGERKP